jgi:hypothetical protein
MKSFFKFFTNLNCCFEALPIYEHHSQFVGNEHESQKHNAMSKDIDSASKWKSKQYENLSFLYLCSNWVPIYAPLHLMSHSRSFVSNEHITHVSKLRIIVPKIHVCLGKLHNKNKVTNKALLRLRELNQFIHPLSINVK